MSTHVAFFPKRMAYTTCIVRSTRLTSKEVLSPCKSAKWALTLPLSLPGEMDLRRANAVSSKGITLPQCIRNDVILTGKPTKFVVCTVDAGSGTLAVMIDGPSKVAIICTEVDEGYEFSYTPMAPGDYLINVKFCNVTIAGCPTKAVITGKGSCTLVKVAGCS